MAFSLHGYNFGRAGWGLAGGKGVCWDGGVGYSVDRAGWSLALEKGMRWDDGEILGAAIV